MGFLAPSLLAGFVTLGLPVYLHLLRRHRTTPRPFSSLMFFEQRIQSSIQHRRLKYLLLFSLRLLLLALLVLAFARPYFVSTGLAAAQPGRVLALLLDRSFSMRQGDRLSRAKNDALTVVRAMRPQDRAQLITFGGFTHLLTNLTGDRAALSAAIQSVEPGDGVSSFAEAVRSVRSLAQTSRTSIEAHLFSDMQNSSAPASFEDLQLPPGTLLIPHPDASADIPNLAVESVLAPHRLFVAKSGRIQATVVNHSPRAETRQLSLVLNNRGLESRSLLIPANGRASAEFTGIDAPFGFTLAEVRISAGDPFPDDDHFYFAIERSDPAPALFVHQSADARSALYFSTALAAAAEPAFHLIDATYAQAATTALDRFAFVVLSDPAPLPRGFENALRSFEQQGGGVLVLLGRNSAAASVPGATDAPAAVAQVDATHPALHASAKWDGIHFLRVAPVPAENARVLLRLDTGAPLLVEQTLAGQTPDAGHLLTFGSAFDNIQNDLPVHPLFVPFVQQLANYLGHAETAAASYTVGASYDLRPSIAGSGPAAAPVEVTGPQGQRILSLAESTRAGTVSLHHQGFYDIRRPNGIHSLAAVNPDRRESDFTILPPETLALWRNTGQPPAAAAASGHPAQRDNEIWWYVLLAALALAVAESLLGNRLLAVPAGSNAGVPAGSNVASKEGRS